MMQKVCIINQFMGLGDILFIIPICKYYHNLGYKILYPVNKEFVNLNDNFDFITFIDKNLINIDYNNQEIVENEDYIILPIRFANTVLNNSDSRTCMSDKYKYFNFPLDMWREICWNRNHEKENKLYYDVLGLSDNEEYNLINKSYSMNLIRSDIKPDNNLRNIEMIIYQDFNILDWCKVFENAKNIYTVSTSIIYILDLLNLKCDEIKLYRRYSEIDFSYYDYLLQKKYKKII
jgi:hypothetical protein